MKNRREINSESLKQLAEINSRYLVSEISVDEFHAEQLSLFKKVIKDNVLKGSGKTYMQHLEKPIKEMFKTTPTEELRNIITLAHIELVKRR